MSFFAIERCRDINRSRIVHLRGRLLGTTSNMNRILPPGFAVAVVAIILSIPFDVRLTRAPDSWPIILLNPKEARRYRIEIMGIALLVVAVVDECRAGTCRALNWSIRRRVFSTICGAIGSFSPCPTCGYSS